MSAPDDREQRRLALALLTADWLREDPAPVLSFAWDNVSRWGWIARAKSERRPYEQSWLDLLAGPWQTIRVVLEAPLNDDHCVALRAHSPFAGAVRQSGIADQHFERMLRERGYLDAGDGRGGWMDRDWEQAISTFEDPDTARRWLARPAPALNGELPIDWLRSADRAEEVASLLGRIEWGGPF